VRLLDGIREMVKKRPPIGISNFKQLIEEGYAYVDKSLFIQELWLVAAPVVLIPRLRRFGKTLNLSMVRYFFEKSRQDHKHLFQSLKIWQDEKLRALQGQFPVIFITLKDVKHASWDHTFSSMRGLMAEEFRRHEYLLASTLLSDSEKELYNSILFEKAEQPLVERSLRLLTEWLFRFHEKRVILLIDEYDAPAHAAYMGEFYDTLISFLRNWLSGALKDNMFLEKGVLTGILRIAKESIFSGVNNIDTFTILSKRFQDKFGLLESETRELLDEFGYANQWDAVKQWYNGYRIGECDGIYNPWSVMNFIDKKGELAPYWVNTSDNALMQSLITTGPAEIKTDIEELLCDGVVTKTVEEGLIFTSLKMNPDAIWSMLLLSGYLSLAKAATSDSPCLLRIPNFEVKKLYYSIILKWFKETISTPGYHNLLKSLTSGDVETFSQIFQEFLLSSFSYFDTSVKEPEKIYHSFVLGMLVGLKESYEIKSNRESGWGRYDVMLIPKHIQDLGIVMEFKKTNPFDKTDLETVAASALQQIEEKQYDLELKQRGVSRILHIGLAFEGKNVLIRSKIMSK
jgi:predicted AAA-ATPase/PD-(D/E)XK nuclease superfamily protein